ncbi:hypothetical protein ACWF50_16455 [Brucella pseudogrignonensis]|jgi:hypothetical protein
MKDYETIDEVHRMHEVGANPTEIGNALSLPRSTVASILRRPIPKSTADRIVVRCVSNGGWSTANHCFSYIAKGDKPPSVKCSYIAGFTQINEWLCPQHTGFAQTKAHRWWTQHGGQRPFPKTVMEWLERQRELLTTDEISIVPNGKYWNVKDVRAGLSLEAHNDNVADPANDNVSIGLSEILDDEIPF